MDVSLIAPLVRGLALSRSAGSPAVVASRDASAAALPPSTARLSFGEAPTESDALSALKASPLAMGEGLPFLLAVTVGSETRLFAAAASLEEARALLEGKPAPAAKAAETKAMAETKAAKVLVAGSAAKRDKVVEGKVALVTGGAQGFGEEIVRGLAASGALVYVADMNLSGAEKLAAELCSAAGRTVALPLAIDVSSEESVKKAFATVAATTGGLDLVVSNAGVLKAASVLEQDLSAFEFVTKVNYIGFFVISKHSARMLRLQRLACPGYLSDIIQINSKSGLEGSNKNGAYAGSKFGGLGLVQSFALELISCGIKVNAICPGNFLDGPLWSDPDKGLFVQYLRTGKVPGAKTIADVRAYYEAKVPMGRGCEGPDVMRAVYYIVEQRYETGQAVPVTGGQVMLN